MKKLFAAFLLSVLTLSGALAQVPIWNSRPIGLTAVGSPVLGGTANSVLFTDSSGNLANSANLTFNGTGTLSIGSTSDANLNLYDSSNNRTLFFRAAGILAANIAAGRSLTWASSTSDANSGVDLYVGRYAAKQLMISGDGTGATTNAGWVFGNAGDGIAGIWPSRDGGTKSSSNFAILESANQLQLAHANALLGVIGGNTITTVNSSGLTVATAGSINIGSVAITNGQISRGGAISIGSTGTSTSLTLLANNESRGVLSGVAGAGLSLTPGTATTDVNGLSVAQGWNAAVTFTAFKVNVAETLANGASMLMDLQRDSSSRFAVDRTGALVQAGATTHLAATGVSAFGDNAQIFVSNNSGGLSARAAFDGVAGSANYAIFGQAGTAKAYFGNNAAGNAFILSPAANTLHIGNSDAAAPDAQTLTVQSVVAGTSDTAGANFTIAGSKGTGTGIGGSIIFQTAAAGGSGSSQNALATVVKMGMGTGSSPALSLASDSAGWYRGASNVWTFYVPSINVMSLHGDGMRIRSGGVLAFTDGESSQNTADTSWSRCAAGVSCFGTGAQGSVAGTVSALNFLAGASGLFYFDGRARIRSPGDGQLTFLNAAENGFTIARFGGTTSSFPALKRSSATLEVKLADDSAYATIVTGHVKNGASNTFDVGESGTIFRAGYFATLSASTSVTTPAVTGTSTALTLNNTSAGTLTFGSNAVTPASSGTRYLCIDTSGVVTSSASACSGT